MSWNGHFKYESMNPEKVKTILEAYKNEQVYDYIQELYELIYYQKEMIKQQRVEIIALKHQQSWNRYDKPIEDYDNSKRKYKDRPERTDSGSC